MTFYVFLSCLTRFLEHCMTYELDFRKTNKLRQK